MDLLQLFKRDLFFYRRVNLTLIALAAVCCAILTGALLVGDSVRYSLRRISELRLGQVELTMSTGDRYFRRELADELQHKANVPAAAVLMQRGVLESADGEVRINNVLIYGVDAAFWKLAYTVEPMAIDLRPDGIWVNGAMEGRLDDKGKELLLRFEQEQALSSELIFSKDEPAARAWPVNVSGTVEDDMLGRFGLTAQQQAPLNVFVPIEWLGQKANAEGKANMLLVGRREQESLNADELNQTLRGLLDMSDLQLELRALLSADVIELASPRIFLDEAVAQSAVKAGMQGYGVFTYFVNEIRSGEKSVPYSMVSAAGMQGVSLAAGLKDNQIVINEWLAQELGADTGSRITLTYFRPVTAARLVEATSAFTVKNVAPMMGVFADPTLMPKFPGLADAENCRDWDAGVPIDLSKIGPRDEAYWNKYKGTPKAYISLDTAKRIWSNRFGTMTAVRWPAQANSIESLQTELLQKIDPAAMGFAFEDVRAAAKAQWRGSSDFAGLFAGLSMFLIFSAAVLPAMVFMFYIESRSIHAGLLMAVGWDRRRMFLFFTMEGAILAAIGCAIGILFSLLYIEGLVAVLNSTSWTKALASLQLEGHATIYTLIKGFVSSFVICMLAMSAGLLGRMNRPVHQLLTGTLETPGTRHIKLSRLVIAAVVLIAIGTALPFAGRFMSEATRFFISGVLLLAGVFCAAAAILKRQRGRRKLFPRSQAMLAARNIPRRSGRNLAVLMTAACGVFLVVSVGTNYKDVGADVQERNSGTGGFTLVAQTTLPLKGAPVLSGDEGLRMPAIGAEAAVAFKVYQQEDASCLNLNRVQQPTLVGVNPEDLSGRRAFQFASSLKKGDRAGWQLLYPERGENVIPVIGDKATVYWALGKDTGDTIEYRTENGGRAVLKVVGILKDSVLQGKLIAAQESFERMFPSVEGYRLFLIDADWANRDLQAQQLSKRYRDAGMEVTPAVQILAGLHEVENTYLAIFLGLGGLGLVLGSAGVGLVLLLNVLDRRGELAMMQAVGFRRQDLQFMLFVEHVIVLAAGVVCGLLPALVAVMPAIRTQGRSLPVWTALLLATAILAFGAIWIRLAVGGVLRMNFLDELKNE